MTDEDKPKVKRMSIYINPNDTVVLDWLKRVTADGTSESKAMLDLIRRTERQEPSAVEESLRQQVKDLIQALERVAAHGTPGGASKPPEHKTTDLASALDDNWGFDKKG